MRATSFRRRSGRRVAGTLTGPNARAGAPSATSGGPKLSSLRLDADDPDAIECGSCGAYVKRLANGRPRAHAPGGTGTSTRAGVYKCPGSGRE